MKGTMRHWLLFGLIAVISGTSVALGLSVRSTLSLPEPPPPFVVPVSASINSLRVEYIDWNPRTPVLQWTVQPGTMIAGRFLSVGAPVKFAADFQTGTITTDGDPVSIPEEWREFMGPMAGDFLEIVKYLSAIGLGLVKLDSPEESPTVPINLLRAQIVLKEIE